MCHQRHLFRHDHRQNLFRHLFRLSFGRVKWLRERLVQRQEERGGANSGPLLLLVRCEADGSVGKRVRLLTRGLLQVMNVRVSDDKQ